MRIAPIVGVTSLVALCASAAAGAQELHPPAGWRWHHDAEARLASGDPRDSAWTFVQMPPGWHITTGPGSVLWDPAAHASGRYSLASQVFLFRNPTDEGYGVFLGGEHVGTDSASYLTVLLRRDGAVAVQSWHGGAVSVVAPWTRHAAITPNPGDAIVENHLRVRVGADSLHVAVNDSTVLALPRTGLRTDGQFGFRVGHGLNLHVTTLDHTRHLAPVPQR